MTKRSRVAMSIGNQEFGIPRKYQSKSVFWYLCLKFLGISLVFIGILSTTLLKAGLILVFFDRIKICLVLGFCGCHFIGIGLVLVCHFPESGISSREAFSILEFHHPNSLLPRNPSVNANYHYPSIRSKVAS